MAILLFILIFFLVSAAIAAPIIYLQIRRKGRDQKNYERGLKMIPLLIHLPPPSEDTESNGRDIRDLVDENISKAQVIYNIIASTLQKGFKAKYYGQRHFAFEIVGVKGFVYFYASVPVTLVEVVKQAIVSAYPSARLEDAPEYNIFNAVGKMSGTVGGELKLKESYAYPIATYQDLKRDAMQALLNSLSTLDKEDGAGIQILMRPADPVWRKNALGIASKKRKGEGGKKGAEKAFSFGKDLATAFVKPPESKDSKSEGKKDLSGLDQAVIDSIEAKTQQTGYEVLIRIVVSSNISQRAQAILGNVAAAFSLFDAPGKNGFKFVPAKDVEEFATSYMMRFFPQTENKNILNATELATIFHFPDQRSIPTSQLERQGSKQVDAPRNMPDKGLLLGYNVFRGVKKPIRLDIGDRQRHMYVVGQTGTGKSTFLENLALQDMLSGGGFAFVDPHGDTAEKLLSMVPKERTEDVIYFSPADMEYPMGLNLFEHKTADEKDFLIQEVLNMLYKLYDPQHQGIMGPRYEHLFRNAALTVMADPEGGTFVDIPKLFRDQKFVQQKLQFVKDQNVLEFWQKEMPQSQRSNEFGEVVSWFVSKFGAFLSNEMMRNIIGQTQSAFDLRTVMDEGKILIVNLSKGRLGMLNSQLLGMIFVMKFQAAAMSRANIPESDRKDFALYVDEFQNFSTDSFAQIMSEARKYHLNLIVANQFTTQLSEEIRDAVFGNIGTIIAFRVGQDEDAEALAKRMRPAFDTSDLLRVPNYNTVARTLVNGVPTQPFSMATLPPLGNPNEKLLDALKQLSAAKYGRPKAVVEKELFARMATKDDTPAGPAFGAPAGPPAGGGLNPFGAPGAPPQNGFGTAPANPYGPPMTPSSPAPAAPKPASFLDDWLVKRESSGPLLRPNPWAKDQPVAQSASLPSSVPQSPAGTNVPPLISPSQQPPVLPVQEPAMFASAPTTQPHSPFGAQRSTIPQAQSTNNSQQQGSPAQNTPAPVAPHNAIDLTQAPSVKYDAEEPEAKDQMTDVEIAAAAEEVNKKLQMTSPVATPPEPKEKTDANSGEIKFSRDSQHTAEDTIYIDQEGILHRRD